MKTTFLPALATVPALLVSLPLDAALVSWTGGANSTYENVSNWDVGIPISSDDVTFDVSTGLRGSGTPQIVDVGSGSVAKTLTIDLAAWSVRPTGNNLGLSVSDSMTFTSNFTGVGAFTTFADAGGDNLRLKVDNNFVMTNNGAGTVTFGDGNLTDFGIAAIGSSANLALLDGSGDYVWNNGIVFNVIERFGTAATFGGTFSVDDGNFRMSVDFRAQGGVIDINGDDLILDTTNVTFNDTVGARDATFDMSGVSDNVGDLNSFNNGGILQVDDGTNIVFGGYNEGTVDILGFVLGSTILQFDGVAGTESLANLTVNGAPATWEDVGGGIYEIVPEPSTYAFAGGLIALGCVLLRRRS